MDNSVVCARDIVLNLLPKISPVACLTGFNKPTLDKPPFNKKVFRLALTAERSMGCQAEFLALSLAFFALDTSRPVLFITATNAVLIATPLTKERSACISLRGRQH